MKRNFIIACLLLISSLYSYADPVEEGKTIFTTRCSSCHNINKLVVGPALAGVDQRHSMDWIIRFVQSSQTLIKSGDKDASALFAKFNNIQMPDHPDLTANNIKSVVDYIKSQTVPGNTPDKAPFPRPEKLRTNYLPISITANYGFFLVYLSGIVLMIFVLLTFVRVKEYERNN